MARGDAPGSDAQMDSQQWEGQRDLNFKDELSWRAGRAIPVRDLFTRLKALSAELRSVEQHEINRDSLLPVAKSLASANLLSHKDRGIRAWTLCCVVDILSLCAPDAPYSGTQLKTIFNAIISSILPELANPSNSYNEQHAYILKSLAEYQTIVLLIDADPSNNLLEACFRACFDVLSGPSKSDSGEELSINVQNYMTDSLIALVNETSGSLPTEVVEIILAQYLRADPSTTSHNRSASKGKKGAVVDSTQSTLLIKDAPAAYNMAKNLCNSCSGPMARAVGTYFSTIIADTALSTMSLGQSSKRSGKKGVVDSDDVEHSRYISEEDLQEVRKAHRLARELWRACPDVLVEIIPQLDAELQTEDMHLRLYATETIGDMVAGIGAAGPPAIPLLNPQAYPSQSVASTDGPDEYNFLTTPTSPQSFVSHHYQAYQNFLGRRNDRIPTIRAAAATGIGRILLTSAGGVGLAPDDEKQLLRCFSDMLVDGDDKVRLSTIRAIETFDFKTIAQRLGSSGPVDESGTILNRLSERLKDKKPNVRSEAMVLVAKIWGVAEGAIAEGSERMAKLFGLLPSRIYETYYINDPDIMANVDRVTYDYLLPLGYPSIKTKSPAAALNGKAKGKKDQTSSSTEENPDQLRTERFLVLVNGLESRAKNVVLKKLATQGSAAKYMTAFIQRCEQYNGGVTDGDGAAIKHQLQTIIQYYARTLPDPTRAAEDLWKFAEIHDRRCYALIKFCIDPESDYLKVSRSIREIMKRLTESAGPNSSLLDVITILLYRTSVLVYNKSHVPSIIAYSRTNAKDLGQTAHDILKEISAHTPSILKAHVKELCQALENEVPSHDLPTRRGAVDDLKACSGFTRHFPDEIPKDRKFMQCLLSYAMYGTPPKTAKHAVTIMLTATDKKELLARNVFQKCTENFEYGSKHSLSRLAALAQLVLLASDLLDASDVDQIIGIAIKDVLQNPKASEGLSEDDSDPEWSDTPDEACEAKMLALKILVNQLRACKDDNATEDTVVRGLRVLHTIVAHGDLPKTGPSPKSHQSRMRLLAAQLLLKLHTDRRFESYHGLREFNKLALVIQDPLPQVRGGFAKKLMQYLGQTRLPQRYYTYVFLLAYEPDREIKDTASTWIKSRAAAFAKAKDTSMEATIARVISLLAHHPDFGSNVESLRDFVKYILFYLECVANEDNISLIYAVAQRVKSVRDVIDPKSENIYQLSDLAQSVIRRFEEIKGWSIQALPAKPNLPATLFTALPSHQVSQDIANRQFIPQELDEEMEDLVRAGLRPKKRKHEPSVPTPNKRSKSGQSSAGATRAKSRKISKPRIARRDGSLKSDDSVARERRRSGRQISTKNYAESSDEEGEHAEDIDEEDVEMGNEEEEEVQQEEDEEEAQAEVEDENEEQEEEPIAAEEVEEPTPAKNRRSGRSSRRR